jgi:lysophospholipase L1-like esterase
MTGSFSFAYDRKDKQVKRLVPLLIAAATATALSFAPMATPTPGVNYGYGSGAIGNWSSWSHELSLNWQFAAAPVWQYGDSIARSEGAYFATRLYNEIGVTLAVDNKDGRPTGPAVDALIADLAQWPAPPVIIMATGTNDIFSPPFIAEEIDRVMAAVPSTTTVLWVNVYAQRWSQSTTVQIADIRNGGWVNMQIAEAEGEYDNLVVVDWFEFLSAYPGYRPGAYLSDGIHTNTDGRQARTTHILSFVDDYL